MDFDSIKSMVEDYFNGQYEVKKFLGEGSFAKVYLVKHNFLDDLRAMKIIKEPLKSTVNVKTVFHEVMIATQLRHEHIISIYDAGVLSNQNDDDLAYFVMEYVPGGNLEQYLNSFADSDLYMPLDCVLDLMKQILQGLNTLHSSKPIIIHRDLKLNNILLSYDSKGDIVIKISDFGFAKEITTNISDIDIAGTRPYMAPESFSKVISTMTDIYATGVIFYQLLTNRYPYDTDKFKTSELMELKPWKGELKPPSHYNPNVSEKLDEIVMKCLEINPDNRYHDASELLSEIMILLEKTIITKPLLKDNNQSDESEHIINDSLIKAFSLAKQENKLAEAIEILESEVLKDYLIRQDYGETLRMWKSEHPDIKLVSKAFTVNLTGCNYELSCNLLCEAIAYNPDIKSNYQHYFDLWKIFINLGKYGNLVKAIIRLEELIEANELIKEMYWNVIHILKTYSLEEIVTEAIKLAELNNLNDAALLMEFAVVCDYNIQEKYSYQLSLWKQNIKLKFKGLNNFNVDTIDYAIDLGTVDSIVAHFKDDGVEIIKNHSTGEICTPSAVLIDENNHIHVGHDAQDMLLDDNGNCVSEFKHEMGFQIPFYFKKSLKTLYPEELSSEILKDLRLSVYNHCGVDMQHAVICVPANSNPLKTKAVNDAADLAGFKSHTLIFEPVAVAVAYDFKSPPQDDELWLVYDLGGATFNTTLISNDDGEIEKIDTAGLDNFGGNVFDWLIVEELFAPKIRIDLNLKEFKKDNVKYFSIFSKLKRAAEDAKKELSKSQNSQVVIFNLFEEYDFKYDLSVDEFKSIIEDYMRISFELCNNLLSRNKYSINDVDKIILSGGSCLSPIVKQLIHDEFETSIEDSINPLTVVSQGAAIYAGNLEKPPIKSEKSNYSLIIDMQKELKGRLFTLNDNYLFLGFSIEFKNNDFTTGKIPVNTDGSFKTKFELKNEYIVSIYHENESITLKNTFESVDDGITFNELNGKYQDFLKHNYILKECDLLNYLERLVQISRTDAIAISPANSILTKLSNIITEKENELKFNHLLDNVKSKIVIVKKNGLFDVDDLKLDEVIENKDFNELNNIYTELIEKYVKLNRKEVMESVFFNLRYDGVYSKNPEVAEDLITKSLNAISESDYNQLFKYINKLYELDERNDD